MSIYDCIGEAIANGTMSEKGAAEYRERMKDAEALAAQRGMGAAETSAFAATEAAKEMERRATNKRAQIQQTALAIDRAWHGAKANKHGLAFGLTDVFAERLRGEGSGVSLVQQQRGNLAVMQHVMAEFLTPLQSRVFGLKQNTILPRTVVEALFGKTGDATAETAAKAWTAGIDHWIDEMQRAGVFIRAREDWRLPQHFDSGAVKNMGQDGFVGQMEQWWHDGKLRLRDWSADGQAYLAPGLADEKARSIFERAYDNITTGGDASIEPGAARVTTMADRYGRRRAFEWADDQAWLEFNRTMGVGDNAIGELMVRHVDKMSRDLALAQTLGPDPDRAAKILLQMGRKEGVSKWWANRLEAMYEINAGHAMLPVSQRLAMGGQALRQFLGSAQLGGAILSSASDFAFMKSTAAWHGLDMTRVMAEYVSRLKPQNEADRLAAMKSASIVEVGLRGLHDVARDAIGDVVAGKGVGGKVDAVLNGAARITGRMVETVIRAQGLAYHTQIGRDAFASVLQARLGDLAPTAWKDLSGVDKRLFTEYGMGEGDWNLIRAKGINQGFVDPFVLSKGSGEEREAGRKLLGAIAGVQRMAIPEGNSITRALMLGKTQAGTWEGELLRSVAQYKGFPMGAFLMHFMRATERLSDGENGWMRGQYIASLIVGTTVMGAASLQLKNIAAGKDPEPMTGDHALKFWANAVAQGGALGILGDQIKATFSAQRLDDPARLLTPAAGLAFDLKELAFGRLQDEANDRQSHTGRQLAKIIRKNTPTVVYTKLAWDRLVNDTLQKHLDPDYAEAFARQQQRAQKEQETQFYWRPGSTSPRPPDLGRAVSP